MSWRAGRFVSNFEQFIKFGLVGGSGTVVNLLIVYLGKKALELGWQINEKDIFLPILGTDFNIRWYNMITLAAFLVANTWNYQMNRMWTFKSVSKVSWWRGYGPFFMTGLGAMVVSQVLLVAMMNPNSPLALPTDIFDDSTGLRTRFYWASAIGVVFSMPINFLINKLWTFRSTPPAVRMVEETKPV